MSVLNCSVLDILKLLINMDSSWKKSWHTFFFSCPSYLPFWSYAPLKKLEWNLMHAKSYEPCLLGFWNFIDGKIADFVFFFICKLSPFLELCPFEKIRIKSCQQDILKSIWAMGLELISKTYAPLKKSEWNLMHAKSCELCLLGFWNFICAKIADLVFFHRWVISLSGVMSFWKNQNKILSATCLKNYLS